MKTAPYTLIAFLISFLMATGAVADNMWNTFGAESVPDQSTWAAYYRKNARVRLGPEQRLENGAIWRLHTDIRTRQAFPRITWMPDAQRLAVANRLLETAHGGILLDNAEGRKYYDTYRIGVTTGSPHPRDYTERIEQTDVGLTYAGTRLLGAIDLGLADLTGGTGLFRTLRGLTFDLEREAIYGVTACPGSGRAYGSTRDDRTENVLFRLENVIEVCDIAAFRHFLSLVIHYGKRGAEAALAHLDNPHVEQCRRYFTGQPIFLDTYSPLPREQLNNTGITGNETFVLFVTLRGLAVFKTEYPFNVFRSVCASVRTPVNPVIVPYAELAPLMPAGPIRDELLALK